MDLFGSLAGLVGQEAPEVGPAEPAPYFIRPQRAGIVFDSSERGTSASYSDRSLPPGAPADLCLAQDSEEEDVLHEGDAEGQEEAEEE